MIKHFPFTTEPFKAQMGLKLLDIKDWIEPDEKRAEQLLLKKKLLSQNRSTVLVVPDDDQAKPAALELHEVLWDHLHAYHPNETFQAPAQTPLSAEAALADTATWVQEDFCLLSPDDYTLMAGIVCFPSRWKLPDKIGKNSDGIHEPVGHFKSIAKPTNGILTQLTKPLVRFNWTIHDSDDLFSPEARHNLPAFKPEEVLQNTFLRVERQTLRRLPASNAIVFSIRTYIHRLDEVIQDSGRRDLLRTTLRSLPEDVVAYRGMRYFFVDLKRAL